MKTATHLQLSFVLLLCLALLILVVKAMLAPNQESLVDAKLAETEAALPTPTPSCPVTTTQQGNQCILTNTLVLPSNTKLDCQNLQLVPKSPGSGTTRSVPEVAIFLNGAHAVEIQRCNIQNFDFGIIAINSKVPVSELPTMQNRIHDNHAIVARYAPITLLHVDDTFIGPNNDLTFRTVGGRGIVAELGSSWNTIQQNKITADFIEKGALRAPGKEPSNLLVSTGGAAIVVGQADATGPTVVNAVIEGQLYQITPPAVQNVDPLTFTANNKIIGNEITIPLSLPSSLPDATDGIVLPVAQITEVDLNKISGATFAVRVGIQVGMTSKKTFPAACSGDPERYCLTQPDCDFKTTLKDTTNRGTCPITQLVSIVPNWLSNSTNVVGNTIGSFGGGITLAGKDTVVTGNDISGPQRPVPTPLPASPTPTPTPAAPAAIFVVGPYALATAKITHNTVTNATIGLSLQDLFSGLTVPDCTASPDTICSNSCMGAQISLNDFTGCALAVQTGATYSFISNLSVNQQGNFWGADCFPKVEKAGSAVSNPAVTDCSPFPAPVARASQLPAPCG